jgi:3',5'-cyclic AMP phosphodiesterase CpdA
MSHARALFVVLALCVSVASLALFADDASTSLVRLGVVTDVHAHDTNSPGEDKVMANYAERLTAFVDAMNGAGVDAIAQLGDLVNGAIVYGAEIGDVGRIGGILAQAGQLLDRFDGPLYHVPGNHDFYNLSLDEYLDTLNLDKAEYSFDLGAFHFVVLDAEHNPDGTHYDNVYMRVKGAIPPEDLDWLRGDLAATNLPTIVLIHQPLDADYEDLAGGPPVDNHLEVRDVLSASGKVVAVFQGHDHENRYQEIDGIHYVTFAAMVDHLEPSPPTWAVVTLDSEARTIVIEGEGLQASYSLSYDLTP